MFVNSDIKRRSINLWLITLYLLLILIIIVGGLTRLTDSGLSITKWELFKGIIPPLNDETWDNYFLEYKQIPEFIYLNSAITLREFKIIFYWEYLHRLLGRFIGLVALVPLIYFFIKFKDEDIFLKKYFIIFALVCFQGAVGWFMVESGLVDRLDVSHFRLALHLFIAFIILSLCFWFILENTDTKPFKYKMSNKIMILILLLIYLQIVLGAFLAGLDGGLVYNTWPDMNGNFFPDDTSFLIFLSNDFLSTPSVIQFIHRITSYFLLILVIYFNFIYFVKKLPIYPIIVFDFFIFLQIILGILTLLSGVKIVYASLHQIGSIFVVSSFLYILFRNNKINLQLSD